MLGERLNVVTVVAVVAAFAGLCITLGGDLEQGNMIGNLAAVASSIGFAGYTVCVRSDPRRDWSPVMPGYAVMMIVLCGAVTVAGGRTLAPPAGDIALAALHGGVFIVVGTLLYNRASRTVPAVGMTVFAQTEMLFVAVWAVLLLDDSPTVSATIGGLVIAAAVVGKALVDARRRAVGAPPRRRSRERADAAPYATLGMYPLEPLRPAWERLWAAVHELAPWTPATLTWTDDVHATWTDPACVVSHACGWPVATYLRDRVDVVGAFSPDLPDASGHRYRSALVASRPASLASFAAAKAVAAATTEDSLTGWISLRAAAGGEWPGPVVWTGGHVASLEALQQRRADLASIDPLTLAYVRRHLPDLVAGLHVDQVSVRSCRACRSWYLAGPRPSGWPRSAPRSPLRSPTPP